MKQAMARIWVRLSDSGLLEWVWPILQIHDSLMLEYPEELHHTVNEIVLEEMQRGEGYSVPITASGEYGYSWGAMTLGED